MTGALAMAFLLTSCSANPSLETVSSHSIPSVDDYLNTVDLGMQASTYAEKEKQKVAKAKQDAELKAKKAKEEVAQEKENARLQAVADEEARVEQSRLEAIEAERIQNEAESYANAPAVPEKSYDNGSYVPPAPVAPAPVVPEVVVPAAPTGVNIYVGAAGGQDVIDSCIGPVLFNGAPGYTYVAEHDSCGGWARFGSLSNGMKVTMSGLVSGTYTVGGSVRVPQGANSYALAPLGSPAVILQTCIPGTNDMIVVGLY